MDADPTTPSTWHTARERFRQLEFATEIFSPAWFAGNIAVIVAAALFLITAIGLSFSLFRIQELSAATSNRQAALLESMRLQEALDDASAAARGYAVEHDPSFIPMRQSAKRTVRESLANLAAITQEDGEAAKQLNAIRPLIGRRVALFDELVTLAQQNAPADRIQKGDGDRIRVFRKVNAALSVFRSGQSTALTAAQDEIRHILRFAVWLVLFAGFSAPIAGLIGIRLLRRVQSDQHTRELQMELMHVQRLAIMGETSAMLAHEINQPLTAASNYLAVLRRHLEAGAGDKALAMSERIGQQIQRAGSILKKLRRFIEKRESERSLEAPEALVEDAITLIGTIDDAVVLATSIGENLPHVLVDRVQLQQVLVNLMRNAIEAMQTGAQHELLLSLEQKDGATVEFSLADSGPGLPEEVGARLFQPFVSTKESGMGVGLSICRSIISQHGGRIWAEPNPGGGTIFRFTIPAAKEQIAA